MCYVLLGMKKKLLEIKASPFSFSYRSFYFTCVHMDINYIMIFQIENTYIHIKKTKEEYV